MSEVNSVSSDKDLRRIVMFLVILLFFFVSGACGLLYQVVWTRKLVLLLGTTSYAVSTVLSVFFMGLGIGSLWGGRLADRSLRPLYIYGLFEIIIGIWAILFILLIGSGESVVVSILSTFSFSRGMSILLRTILSMLFLIVPVTLMGATLPLLAKFVTTSGEVRGRPIGILYSINTFGAVVGCALTGFYFLPTMGYTRATLLGAAANCLVGIIAIFLGRKGASSIEAPAQDVVIAPSEKHDLPVSAWTIFSVMLVFAISGFCALSLEVLWTRLLAIVFLGTTYAFTTMLTALLCGIATGSIFASAIVDKVRHRVSLLGIIEVLIGLSCIMLLAVFEQLPDKLLQYQRESGLQWGQLLRAKFVLCFMVLFVPMFLSGMTFPLAVKSITGKRDKLGRDIGRLYSANTFGGVFGALAGGYLIIPMLGTQQGILLLGLAMVIAGAFLIISCPTRRAPSKAGFVFLAVILTIVAFNGAPKDISRTLNQWFVPEDHNVIHYEEGVEATVLVSEPKNDSLGSDRILWINGVQATATIEKGVKMNRLQGILPMLFDREPREALFMCLGSGITCGTLALSDFERIDAVEISQDVFKALHNFEKDNFNVAENPKVNFVIDDGRNFLLTTKNKYDVITFEPMPLALAGVSTFYTEEYYELCMQHLRPGGLVSQWIPLHSLRDDLVRSLVFTFTSVFPHYNAWFVNSDLFIIGSNEPLKIDYEMAKKRFEKPELMKGLQDVGLSDFHEVLTSFIMGQKMIDEYTREYQIPMVDDRPWAEFLAPKLVYERNVAHALESVQPYFENPLEIMTFSGISGSEKEKIIAAIKRRSKAHEHDLVGLKTYYGGVIAADPGMYFKESLEIDPDDYNARYYLTEISVAFARRSISWDQLEEAQDKLLDAVKYDPKRLEAHLLLGDVYFDQNEKESAAQSYKTYLSLGGTAPRAVERTAPKSK